MLKWREFTEDNTLFEVFLPEHDGQGMSAVLRAVRRGHIVAERRVDLTWRPTFGPDRGDVEAISAQVDRMITELASRALPLTEGSYVPEAVEVEEPNPALHAALFALLEAAQPAIAGLELEPAQVQAWLGLPDGCALGELYPMAITPPRARGMHQAVALRRLMEGHEALRPRRSAIVAAALRGDTATVRAELEAAGVRFPD